MRIYDHPLRADAWKSAKSSCTTADELRGLGVPSIRGSLSLRHWHREPCWTSRIRACDTVVSRESHSGTKESADLTSVIYDRSSARVSGDLRLGMDVLSRLPYSHVIASRLTRSGSQPPLAGREYMQCPSCVHSPLSRPCTSGLC